MHRSYAACIVACRHEQVRTLCPEVNVRMATGLARLNKTDLLFN